LLLSTFAQDRAFVTTWSTENAGSATKTIVIPTSSSGVYACTVDWEDGKTDYITTYNSASWTHVYSNTGTYTVKIYGRFSGIFFNNAGDRLKILTIEKWGHDFRLGVSQGSYFSGCANLTIKATEILNLLGTTSLASTFNGCTSMITIPTINSWDTGNITSMASMFKGCTVYNQNLSEFKSEKVTSMSEMFSGCSAFNGSVSGLNTALVTNISSMFSGCTVFNQPVSGFNTSNVTLISSMFLNCTAFNQGVNTFDTAKVTFMSSMFNGCTSFNQPVSNFNTALVTSMASMFQGCTSFNQAVETFNTIKVTNMSSMFQGCVVFDQVVGLFNTAAVTTMVSMFNGCTSFNRDVSAFNIAKLTTAANMFTGSGFSQNQYVKVLNSTTGWPSQSTILSAVSFSAGTAKYTTGSPLTGRAFLTVTKLWTITDGGLA